MSETRIVLPNEWDPEPYQMPSWQYLEGGGLRVVSVWHRRAGKDSYGVNWAACGSQSRVGNYWHLLPEYSQGRKAIWDAIDGKGRRVIDQAFPEAMRSRTVDDEMKIVCRNGATWQVGGSDRFNALVGSNPVGVVFSEYSISNPAAWDFIRPILLENGGWAIFLYTPRGKNHGHKLFAMAKAQMERAKAEGRPLPDWYAELLTVDMTKRRNGEQVITPRMIESERESGMDDDMVDQEYYCSWMGVRQGSIYGQAMQLAQSQGRVGQVPYDKRFPVNTFWDIGHADGAAVIFHQDTGAGRNHFIHAHEKIGEDMPYFMHYLKERGYLYGKHYFPHDAKNVTMAAKSNPLGKNIWDQAKALGMHESDMVLVPRTPDLWTAITATRVRIDTCYFDAVGCADLVNCLESYHKTWDDERKSYSNTPYKDWTSEYVDAFRQWGTGYTGQRGAGTFSFPSAPQQIAIGGRPKVVTIANRRSGY